MQKKNLLWIPCHPTEMKNHPTAPSSAWSQRCPPHRSPLSFCSLRSTHTILLMM